MSNCSCSSNEALVARIEMLEKELKVTIDKLNETESNLNDVVNLVRRNVDILSKQQEGSEQLLRMIDMHTDILAEMKGRRLTD